MKKILGIITALLFAGGVAFAGCGKKVTNEGEFTYNEDKKVIKVEGAKKPIKLQPKTVIKDAEGNEVAISDLEGSKVKVVSEHNKADSVTGVAS